MGLTQTFSRITTKRGQFSLRKEYGFHNWVSKKFANREDYFTAIIPVEDCEEIAKAIIKTVQKQRGCQRISGTKHGVTALENRIIKDKSNRYGERLISVNQSDFEKIGIDGIFDEQDLVNCFNLAVRLLHIVDIACGAGEAEIVYTGY